MSKRRSHSAEFKARVALEALKGIEPVHVIAARFEVHPSQVTAWKKEIADRLPELFGKRSDHDPHDAAEREKELYRKIGQLQVENDWAKKKLQSLDCDRRRGLIEKDHPKMTVKRQCEFLGVPRATHYYRPRPASEQNLALMRAIDELHLAYPQFGSRNFVYWLTREGWRVNRKRVQRLMRKMGMEALVLKRRGLSKPHPGHPVYPYLLRGLEVTRPNQVWSADITYVPIRGGCAYLVAILDWYSRKVLAWELSNTLDAGFCARALRRALSQYGNPEIFNTDQGSQFTSAEWLGVFKDRPTRISMDGRGRAIDNIFIERLWRTVKYAEIYLKDYVSLIDAHAQLDTFFRFYNDLRPHRAHHGATPAEVYNAPTSVVLDA